MIGNYTPYWWTSKLAVAPTVRQISAGNQVALFCSRSQTLHELNYTAAFIWQSACQGQSCAGIASHLAAEGASLDDAQNFAVSAVSEWLQRGYLIPDGVLGYNREPRSAELILKVDTASFVLRFFGDADCPGVRSVFGHFANEHSPTDAHIDIVSQNGCNFLFFRDEPRGMFSPDQTPPRVKALITGEYVRTVREGFLAHGALLSANGTRVLLSGAPGAGKTTLSLALASVGFAYGGDDIVRVNASGQMCGVPFAAAAKTGSWPLIEPFIGELSSMPIYERDGGILTRYILPKNIDELGARPVDMIFFLARAEGQAAEVARVEPLDAMQALLSSGWSERHSIEAETLTALADNLSQAALYRLTYSDLSSAVACVRGLVDKQSQ